MIAVTTFPNWGWETYAEYCVRSWVSKWPGPILAYYEGDAPPPPVAGVVFRSLDSLGDRKKFLRFDVAQPRSYLHDVKRFCHKVFAQLDALKEHDQVWWLDADVEAVLPISEDLINNLTHQSFVTYLGRNTYTETGVIGFNKAHPLFDEFESRYRSIYMTGQILHFPYQTDCHAFDYARKGQGHNLTPDGLGVNNVLEDSVLGTHLVHHKGNRKLRIERSEYEAV